ncbi:erv26 super protein [Dispira simplex]|nr:erv26 super protein [Dispira simplex]
MVSLLSIISILGLCIGLGFVMLCVMCGLYYISEIAEERTRWFRRALVYTTWAVMTLHPLLWLLDELPLFRILFSAGCQAVYTMNLRTFPFTDPEGLPFLATCVLAIANHFQWFLYFVDQPHPWSETVSFFVVCIWLVPLLYLVSLNTTDNQLPNININTNNPVSRRTGLLKTFFGTILGKSDPTPPARSRSY